jgi:L-threonylcarbamoyladenylate synthase
MNDVERPRVLDARLDPRGASQAAISELRSGRIVGLATDTVYGLAARVDDDDAIAEIHDIKGRPDDRRLAVLVADVDQAARLVDMTGAAGDIASVFWPGPLTIVATRNPSPTVGVGAGVGDQATIAVRCPDDEVVRAIAAEVGPLAATSANRHGDSPLTSASEVADMFPSIRVVLDGGERGDGASTVVSVAGDELEMIRQGPIEEYRLREVVDSGLG